MSHSFKPSVSRWHTMRGMPTRIPVTAALLALLAITALRAQSAPPRATASIADVSWIAGSWTSRDAKETVEEHWTAPAGGAMLAVGRTVRDGKLAEFEFLRIIERNGGLVYVAQPNGRPPTDFTMTRVDDHSVTFENPAHDFPKMIRYEKRSEDSIVASIAGASGARPIAWTYTSAK